MALYDVVAQFKLLFKNDFAIETLLKEQTFTQTFVQIHALLLTDYMT